MAELESSPRTLFSDAENTQFDLIKADIANFEDYERQFQEVLLSLESEDVLDEFRAEYSGLHHSFLKSHEGEGRLLRKCEDLQSDIFACIAKSQSAQELSEGDRHTIDHLKAEAEEIKRKTASTKEKESLLKSKIYEIKRELAALEKVAQEPVEAAAMENALQSLQRVHETVMKEKEAQQLLLQSSQYECTAAERRIQKLQEKKLVSDEELRLVKERIEAKQAQVKELLATKQEKEDLLKAHREKLKTGKSTFLERQARVDQLREDHLRNGEEISKVNAEVESLTEEYHGLLRQLQQLNASVQECNEENDALQKEVKETTELLSDNQREVDSVRKESMKQSKIVDALRKRNIAAEASMAEAEALRDQMHEEMTCSESELAFARDTVESLEKKLASLQREQNLLHEKMLTAEEVTARNKHWLTEKRAQLYHSEHELQAFENEAEGVSASIYKMMKECEKYDDRIHTHALNCATTAAEIKMKERQVAEVQHKAAEIEVRVRKQQNLLDSISSDRKAYGKHYDQLRHELAEMTSRFQLVLTQISQMKGEVVSREREVIVAEERVDVLQRQKREIEGNIVSYQRITERRVRGIEALNDELKKLGDVLAKASDEASRQRRRCRDVVHERDLLDRQSTQRVKELTNLCERIHSQMGLLQRGEAMYAETTKHMEQIEYQTASMEKELQRLRQVIDTLPDLRLAVNKATRDLQQARVKVRAMLTESSQPINLHPYHELAWSDAETFKRVERVTALQRELNRRRAMLRDVEEEIKAKEATYLSAKAVVAKQPGPEVSEQLSAYHEHLLKKRSQLRRMQESLAFFREQTEQYQDREEALRQRLDGLAKAYASREEAKERELRREQRGLAEKSSPHSGTVEDSPYVGFIAPAPPSFEDMPPPVQLEAPQTPKYTGYYERLPPAQGPEELLEDSPYLDPSVPAVFNSWPTSATRQTGTPELSAADPYSASDDYSSPSPLSFTHAASQGGSAPWTESRHPDVAGAQRGSGQVSTKPGTPVEPLPAPEKPQEGKGIDESQEDKA